MGSICRHVHKRESALTARFLRSSGQQLSSKSATKPANDDLRLKARFLSYRLNVPTADESEVLLTVEDFKLASSPGR